MLFMFTLIKIFLIQSILAAKIDPIGSSKRPVMMAMVPGQDTVVLNENGQIIQKCLENESKLQFNLFIPNNFVAIVESLGTKRVDIALMNTFGYILAHEKYQADARLIGTYKGKAEYYGQIITREDGLKDINEITGKSFAFVDPASTSGYILPNRLFEMENIKPKSTIFAGKHDSVVTMVYQGRIDAGATYHTLADNGVPQDARTLVKTQYPDVFSKVKILKVLGPIPSDPIVFGHHVDKKIQDLIVNSMKKCALKNEVKEAFMKTYHLDGVVEVDDSKWDDFRKTYLHN